MIHLGHDLHGKLVRLDLERLVATHMLLQANSGGGEIWALRRHFELIPCSALDRPGGRHPCVA
jgi:hypothetical protein